MLLHCNKIYKHIYFTYTGYNSFPAILFILFFIFTYFIFLLCYQIYYKKWIQSFLSTCFLSSKTDCSELLHLSLRVSIAKIIHKCFCYLIIKHDLFSNWKNLFTQWRPFLKFRYWITIIDSVNKQWTQIWDFRDAYKH